MKRLFVLALIYLMSTGLSAQDSTKTKTKTLTTGYLSVGLSLSNGDNFKTGSYSSIEGGINRGNIGLGLVFGRGNLDGIFKDDNIRNYYYEAKTSFCHQIGDVTGMVMFGWGQYIDTPHSFIEYGGGVTYSVGRMGYGIMVSNWDRVNYLTPSITLNF